MKKIVFIFIAFMLLAGFVEGQTIADYDGNIYETVTIDKQVWMKENLKTCHYMNGDLIPNYPDTSIWNNLTTGARCYYDNDSVLYANYYGALYNWYAASDSRKICPTGWHIPTYSDFMELITFMVLNGYNYDSTTTYNRIAKSLASTTDWDTCSVEGAPGNNLAINNRSNFTALPTGCRLKDGAYIAINKYTTYWVNDNTYDLWGLLYDKRYFYPAYIGGVRGASIRCIKDSLINETKENKKEINYRMYPNPASSALSLELGVNSKTALCKVYDIWGTEIMNRTFTGDKLTLDISGLARGLYLLRVEDEKGIMTAKFVKE